MIIYHGISVPIISLPERWKLYHFCTVVWFQEISIPPPQRVTGNYEGVLKAKICKGKYEPKLEFPEGWGSKPKKPSLWGVWIFFLEQRIYSINHSDPKLLISYLLFYRFVLLPLGYFVSLQRQPSQSVNWTYSSCSCSFLLI